MGPDHPPGVSSGSHLASGVPIEPFPFTTQIHDQGATVNPTEHTTKTSDTTRGIFALLGSLVRVKGTGAPSALASHGTGAPNSTTSAGVGVPVSPTGGAVEASPIAASDSTVHRQVHPTQPDGTVPAAYLGCSAAPAGDPGRGGASRSRTQPLKCALHMKGRGQRYAPAIAVLTAIVALAAPCAANAANAWWHVTSGSRPTNLKGGYAQNEVRSVTVTATGGTFALTNNQGIQTGGLAFNASAGELQAGLEGAFGVGNALVTGGPPDTATGFLIGPASGMGKLTSGSEKVEEVAEAETRFAVGQTIEGAGIPNLPAPTTIVKIEGETLTLSATATASAEHVPLTGLASKTVEVTPTGGGAFTEHEEVLANGIPAGTTIETIEHGIIPGTFVLTLSNAASETRTTEISSALAPYTVEFVEAFARTPVRLEPIGVELTLPKGPGSVSSTRVSEGRPDGEIEAKVYNLGDAQANGEASPIVITDTLPAGLTALAAEAGQPFSNQTRTFPCTVQAGGHVVVCEDHELLAPYAALEVRVAVQVGAVSGENQVTVSGGEGRICEPLEGARFGQGKFSDDACLTEVAEGGSYERVSTGPIVGASLPVGKGRLTLSSALTPFGMEDYEMVNEGEGGAPDTQAGSHPFQTTFSVALNQGPDKDPPTNGRHSRRPAVAPAVLPKDLNFTLPPGWIGNPSRFPRCSTAAFLTHIGLEGNRCAADAAMGVATVNVHEPSVAGAYIATVPVFNLEPNPGEPARLGFFVPPGSEVYIDTSVRTGGDYGITSSTHNITQFAGFLSAEVSIWGVPGDPRHDSSRGWGCISAGQGAVAPSVPPCTAAGQETPPAFLSLPTSCTGPLTSTASGDSWSEPENEHELAESIMPPLTGCNRLPFEPSIRVTPDGQAASSSTGLKVDVHVPQEETLNSNGLAEADPKTITVALPPGVAVNPSGGDGLQACPELESQGGVGFTGEQELPSLPGTKTLTFTEKLPSPLQPGLNFCSTAAKIGTVKIKTPILPNPIEGAVYLATQNQNPFGSLIAIYLVAEDPVSGVLVKLAGKVSLCQGAGEDDRRENLRSAGPARSRSSKTAPRPPFEDAELEFFGGERAPLATPSHCGAYTTTASFTPWSGNAPVNSTSTSTSPPARTARRARARSCRSPRR